MLTTTTFVLWDVVMCHLVEGTEDKLRLRDVRALGPYHFMGAEEEEGGGGGLGQ